MNITIKHGLLLACVSLLLSGCATYSYTDAPPTLGVMYSKYVYLGYDGDPRPIEDVGIITTDGLIQIQSIDGQAIYSFKTFKTSGFFSGGRFQLHLLPGTHTLVMGYYDDRGSGTISWSTSAVTKVISIDKGQVIHLSVAGDGSTWTAKESDGRKALTTITGDFRDLAKHQ